MPDNSGVLLIGAGVGLGALWFLMRQKPNFQVGDRVIVESGEVGTVIAVVKLPEGFYYQIDWDDPALSDSLLPEWILTLLSEIPIFANLGF